MTFDIERRKSEDDHRRLPPTVWQRARRGATFVSVGVLCAWTLCSILADTGANQIDLVTSRGDKLDLAVSRGDKLVVLKPNAPAANVHISFFDPRSSLDFLAFASRTPLQGDGNLPAPMPSLVAGRNPPDIPPTSSHGERVAQKILLPMPRPGSAPSRDASASDTASAKPSIFAAIFHKLFGKPDPVKLAYAATDDGDLAVGQSAAGRYDRWTAVYDISARTVYMPDGTRLEAHSGLGSLLDDPRHPDEKMHGVTPPNVYDLELREAPFHGVRALRMIPQDDSKTFGRSGLLAHTYMLGPNGDSNGCVSFKNYDAFLQAYLDHKVKRLAVVTSL
jgi:Protein of unknown function (DUF2778)